MVYIFAVTSAGAGVGVNLTLYTNETGKCVYYIIWCARFNFTYLLYYTSIFCSKKSYISYL